MDKELSKEEIINIPERIFLLADEENGNDNNNDFSAWDHECTYWSKYKNSEMDIEFLSKQYADQQAKKKAIAFHRWVNFEGFRFYNSGMSSEQLYESEEFEKYLEQQKLT